MKKNRTFEVIICVVVWVVIIGLVIAINVKHHELTPEEIEAAKTTEMLRQSKETTTAEEVEEIETIMQETTESAQAAVEPDQGNWQEPEEETATDPEEETEAVRPTPNGQGSKYDFTSDEIWEMTRIVYLENGITYPECTYTTVYLTACVILNRLYDWDECPDVYAVIFQQGQYSTAYRYEDYDGSDLGTSNPDGWKMSSLAVYEAISDCDRHPHFQSMAPQGEVYYTDPTTGEVFCY